MKKTDKGKDEAAKKALPHRAKSPTARENQLIALAYDVAERQLREGTASSQIISHFLKLGSTSGQLEKDILTEQKKLIRAKAENLESAKRSEELYNAAIEAMKKYSGHGGSDDDDN